MITKGYWSHKEVAKRLEEALGCRVIMGSWVVKDEKNAEALYQMVLRSAIIGLKIHFLENFCVEFGECDVDGRGKNLHNHAKVRFGNGEFVGEDVTLATSYKAVCREDSDKNYDGIVWVACESSDDIANEMMCEAERLVYAEEIVRFYPDWDTHYGFVDATYDFRFNEVEENGDD